MNRLDRLPAALNLLGLPIAVPLALVLCQPAYAAGTSAGTVISNSATVDYDVGGIDQDDITSAAVTFKVDRKVDLTMVSATALVSSNPSHERGENRSRTPWIRKQKPCVSQPHLTCWGRRSPSCWH